MFTKPSKVYPDLKAKRESLGYTQTQLARIATVSQHTIIRAEQGHPIRDEAWRWIDEALNG